MNNYDYNSENEDCEYSHIPSLQQSFDEEELDHILGLLCEEELDPLQIQVDPITMLQPQDSAPSTL